MSETTAITRRPRMSASKTLVKASPRKSRASHSSSGSSLDSLQSSTSDKGIPDLTEDFDGDNCVGPDDLDEACDFAPEVGDAVWVKEKNSECDVWFQGEVLRGARETLVRGGKQGMSYSVRYDELRRRRYFAPLLGEIKPNTTRVRRLLSEAGYATEN